ncbi:nitroreductase family protein [Paenibacillus farraposensis]|uniref:Nitroreductase family protein n=1 Tax=Paenibacillus farraposensis TaxID=2807095 RepID=A0ABW4DAG1_9BACL|nr:nitroreductase family protein [Paenibacillus farraposensis]MCC3379088.1 nitroreductase family protein [Paenibacillus farraposensis]
MGELVKAIQERRSASKFIPDVTIDQKELEEIFQLVKYAPSAFNLQHAHYIVVQDADIKQRLHDEASKQYKILTSSATIVVLGDTEAYTKVAEYNEGFLNLGVLSKQEYDSTVESVTQFYRERGPVFQREEAVRNASLSAMQFMLIAKDKGWDTCPMIGFDPVKVQEVLNIPEHFVPVMMITLGKEDVSGQRPRGYRKPIGQFVSYNGF